MSRVFFGLFLVLLFSLRLADAATSPSLQQQRQLFLKAEQAVKKNDTGMYQKSLEALKAYPLYPYLQYQWLTRHPDQNKAIQQFLLDFPTSRYAVLLKSQWLKNLVKQKDWEQLIKHYRNTSRADLQCAYYWAKYQQGFKKMALAAARKLWVVGKSQPALCNPLFNDYRPLNILPETCFGSVFRRP